MDPDNQIFSQSQKQLIRHIQVNLPFSMFVDPAWQDVVFSLGLNPEIGLDAEALDRFGKADFLKMAEKLHARGLSVTVHGPFLDLSPGSPDAAIREVTWRRFRQMIAAIEVFQPKHVVCHAAYDTSRYEFCREQWTANSVETWQWLAPAVNARGARLMLENVYERSPDDLLEVFQSIHPGPIGCCLDIGHQAVFSPTPLSEWIGRLAPFIEHLHIHDNHGDHDAHLPVGSGSIDFNPVADFLAARTPIPVITLEPHCLADFQASLAYLERHPILSIFSNT